MLWVTRVGFASSSKRSAPSNSEIEGKKTFIEHIHSDVLAFLRVKQLLSTNLVKESSPPLSSETRKRRSLRRS
jgi:hypothetical protein